MTTTTTTTTTNARATFIRATALEPLARDFSPAALRCSAWALNDAAAVACCACPHGCGLDGVAVAVSAARALVAACYDAAATPVAELGRALGAYNLGRDYTAVCGRELLAVEAQRRALWTAAGAMEGLTLRAPIVLTPGTVENVLAGDRPAFTAEDKAAVKAAREGWRLSFEPGAIISAAEHTDPDEPGALACFAHGAEYEGTALNMAADPRIAVLLRVGPNGKRRDGFQMVALTAHGVAAYGGCYAESSISDDRAHKLAHRLACRMAGAPEVAESGRAAFALRRAMGSIRKELNFPAPVAEVVPRSGLRHGQAVRENKPCDRCAVRSWTSCEECPGMAFRRVAGYAPVEGVNKAYRERTTFGGFFAHGVDVDGAKLFSAWQLNEWLTELGVAGESCHCDRCGNEMDADEAISGDDYGMPDELFCDQNCLESAIHAAADAELNGVYLIDGELYALD